MFGASSGSCGSPRGSYGHLAPARDRVPGEREARLAVEQVEGTDSQALCQSLGSAAHRLCDLEQVASPLPTCVLICKMEAVISRLATSPAAVEGTRFMPVDGQSGIVLRPSHPSHAQESLAFCIFQTPGRKHIIPRAQRLSSLWPGTVVPTPAHYQCHH